MTCRVTLYNLHVTFISESLPVLGPRVELGDVLAADAAGADAHPPLGVLRSLENALLHETLLPKGLNI